MTKNTLPLIICIFLGNVIILLRFVTVFCPSFLNSCSVTISPDFGTKERMFVITFTVSPPICSFIYFCLLASTRDYLSLPHLRVSSKYLRLLYFLQIIFLLLQHFYDTGMFCIKLNRICDSI